MGEDQNVQWDQVFDEIYERKEGVGQEELTDFTRVWNVQLSDLEIQDIQNRLVQLFKSPPFDPTLWRLPQKDLPLSYLDFLRYSDGGEFQTGDRYFQFFSIHELREYNLAYEFPEYMEGCISFGMDGAGNHYIFDMREPMRNHEYPIIAAHSGDLDYSGSIRVADSFLELCEERTSLDDLREKIESNT
ncbi:SMI1/KNR4 family protein [Paenibacillus turpanensis]|uniref:SMI1/KNR4 family protein n=1 Tax=Paenibacillus turpanensis TaxID=2689078 RepID=UPI003C79752C